jgi:hypothetical protein
VLKGFYTNAKKRSEIRANYSKIMKFLGKYEKFNPRYFNATYYLMNGHDLAFWGFLDDVYCFYNGKVSPHDRRYQSLGTEKKKPANTDQFSDNQSRSNFGAPKTQNDSFYNKICYNTNPTPKKRSNSIRRNSFTRKNDIKVTFDNESIDQTSKQEYGLIPSNLNVVPTPENHYQLPHHVSTNTNQFQTKNNMASNIANETDDNISQITYTTANTNINKRSSYAGKHLSNCKASSKNLNISRAPGSRSPKSILKQSGPHNTSTNVQGLLVCQDTSRGGNSRYVKIENTKPSFNRKVDPKNMLDLQKLVYEWLEFIGVKSPNQEVDRSTLFKDPFRNGYFLCLIISKVYGKTMPNVCKLPNSIQECSLNVEQALNILRENSDGLPYDLLWKKENILKGDATVIYP